VEDTMSDLSGRFTEVCFAVGCSSLGFEVRTDVDYGGMH
jgi:hypothetical protein